MSGGGIAPSRRDLLTGAAACAAAALIPHAAARAASVGTTLASLAAEKGVLFGASFATHELDQPHGTQYAELYARETRILTSELELKLASIRPDSRTIELGPADRLVDFAIRRGLEVRGHTLIWNDNVPAWVKRLGATDIERLLDAHIDTCMTRYRGRIRTWDVVNEPIAPWDRQPGNLRAGPFLSALGEAYIDRAFREARKADPGAKLVLNEAFTETADERGETYRTSFAALLDRLKDRGTPIDAIGLQGHLSVRKAYDLPKFRAFVEDIAARGYEVHITELDVDDTGSTEAAAARDRRVADLYRQFLGAVLAVPAVKLVQTWQLADHTSWLHYDAQAKGQRSSRLPRPLPFDASFKRKPAWDAIAAAFEAAPPR